MSIKVTHIHATSLNVGDEAIVDTIYEFFSKYNASFFDVTNKTIENNKIEDYCNDFNLKKISEFISKSDLVLVGGGDLITSWSFIYICLFFAWVYSVPVFLVGVGVNFEGISTLKRMFIKKILRWPKLVLVREKRSFNILKKEGVKNIILTSDILFYNKKFNAKKGKEKNKNDYIVFSIRSPESKVFFWGDKEYEEIASAFDYIVKKFDIDFLFLPMLSKKRNLSRKTMIVDDETILEKIYSFMKEKRKVKIFSENLDYVDVKKVIEESKILVGTRLHTLIFATLGNTPFVALSYGWKTDSFIKEVGMEMYSAQLKNIKSQVVIKLIECCLRDELVIKNKLKQNKEKLIKLSSNYEIIHREIEEIKHGGKNFYFLRNFIANIFISSFEIYSKFRKMNMSSV